MGGRAVANDSIADQKMLRCFLPKSQDKLELGQWEWFMDEYQSKC
jgi:hypothetical protein